MPEGDHFERHVGTPTMKFYFAACENFDARIQITLTSRNALDRNTVSSALARIRECREYLLAKAPYVKLPLLFAPEPAVTARPHFCVFLIFCVFHIFAKILRYITNTSAAATFHNLARDSVKFAATMRARCFGNCEKAHLGLR